MNLAKDIAATFVRSTLLFTGHSEPTRLSAIISRFHDKHQGVTGIMHVRAKPVTCLIIPDLRRGFPSGLLDLKEVNLEYNHPSRSTSRRLIIINNRKFLAYCGFVLISHDLRNFKATGITPMKNTLSLLRWPCHNTGCSTKIRFVAKPALVAPTTLIISLF